jgi:F0F1-type ATP synthase assembly protein I
MNLIIPRVLGWQFVIGAALAAVLWGVYGDTAGYSALLGSLACVVPNAFLGLRLMAPRQDAKALLRAAWIGELIKLAFHARVYAGTAAVTGGAVCRFHCDAAHGFFGPADAPRHGKKNE